MSVSPDPFKALDRLTWALNDSFHVQPGEGGTLVLMGDFGPGPEVVAWVRADGEMTVADTALEIIAHVCNDRGWHVSFEFRAQAGRKVQIFTDDKTVCVEVIHSHDAGLAAFWALCEAAQHVSMRLSSPV